MPIAGVYAIAHRETGSVYVGSSLNVRARWRGHVSRLNYGTHHSPMLQELWRRDGLHAFTFLILELCDISALAVREQSWMDSFEHRLNKSRTARHCPTLNPAIAAKAAAARRGRSHSPEHRSRISAALMGHEVTAEARAKMRAAVRPSPKSPPPRSTPSSIARMVETRRRLGILVPTPEHLRTMQEARRRRGYAVSAEHRAKIAAANRGRLHTNETRAKVGAAIREWWAIRKQGDPACP